MFPIESVKSLNLHNIRLSKLNPTQSSAMSQSQRLTMPKPRMLSRGTRAPAPGVRITNVRSIKPPDGEAKKHDDDKLRSQVQKEIASRSRTCDNKKYLCQNPVVANRQYCALHIAQDPQSGYKQCSHTNANTRCIMPAPSDRENSLCFDHARIALLARQRSAAPPPVTTTETLLNQLQHYVRGSDRVRTTSCASSVSVVSEPSDNDPGVAQPLDPFKEIDARAINAAYSTSLIECGSCTESDADDVTDDEARMMERDLPLEDDDGEVLNQPLWRAGVYTAEEAIRSARDTLVSLQNSYKRQMGRMKLMLHQARLQYLRDMKNERDNYCSINTQARSGPLSVRERRQLKKLKAYASYRRKHGVHAILAKKLHTKRAKASGALKSGQPIGGSRCVFSEFNVRCSNTSLPAAKVCAEHVLHDTRQVLFAACGDLRGGQPCKEPIPKLPLASSSCRYHTNPPVYTVFTLKKDGDSDSDSHSTSTATELNELLEGNLDMEPISDGL